MKILVTGGHITPALSVIDELEKRNIEIVFVGRRHALEGDASQSAEYSLIRKRGLRFYNLTTGRVQRFIAVSGFISIFKIPIGFVQAFQILLKERPNAVMSFGGYIAVPIVCAAFLLRIPIVTHEQTMRPGLANRMIGFFATKIGIAWKETAQFFPKAKTKFTGNPIRKDIFTIRKKFTISDSLPLLYITGGNLGSQSINGAVTKIIPQLLKTYTIIHQCGSADNHHDFKVLTNLQKELPEKLGKRYTVFEYVDDEHIGWVLQNAYMVISRSGANIVSELIALAKPSLLIPLPWSGSQEQLVQAQFLVSHNAAGMLMQKEVTGEIMVKKLTEIEARRNELLVNLRRLQKEYFVSSAANRLVEILESVIRS